jgi:hypothetical protein
MECQRRIDADATLGVLDRIVAARGHTRSFCAATMAPS